MNARDKRKRNRMKNRIERSRNKIKKTCILSVLAMMVLSFSACNPLNSGGKNGKDISQETVKTENKQTGFVAANPDSYDSADTCLLVDKNTTDKTVTFLNFSLERQYTLSYDGTTRLFDRFGETVSIDQIKKGDVVDITFLKRKKHLTDMRISSNAWKIEDVDNYAFNTVKNEISIGNEIYKYTDKTMFFSEEHPVEMMDLNATDLLDFQGVDNTVVSVSVKKGHGYLRLKNDANFVGGWIEIGQSQIRKISEDMLLVVAEGSYDVNISHNGGGGVKRVTIRRNEESVLDIGDLEIPKPQEGVVIFSMTPSSAELYVDGTQADPSSPITMQFGIHQLIIKAEGYKSVTQYINVNRESVGVDVVLDKRDGSDEDDDEDEKERNEDSLTDYYKVYIDAPDKAEVYVDGNYVGISPCFFRKTEGTHVVTLRRSGYETRSYTIQVDEKKKDITYSFADLVAMEGTSTTVTNSESKSTSEGKTESSQAAESSSAEKNTAESNSSESRSTAESNPSESQSTAESNPSAATGTDHTGSGEDQDSKEQTLQPSSDDMDHVDRIFTPKDQRESQAESRTTQGDADTESTESVKPTDGRAIAEK